jgi:hypothetical protein
VAILAALWVAYCSGKSAGASHQKAHDADAAVSAVRDSNDRWKARYLARDSARDDSLARLQQSVTGARGEIARLKASLGGRPGEPHPTIPGVEHPATTRSAGEADSVPLEIAVRDSIIAQQDTVIAQQDSQLTLYRAQIADRDSLLVRKDRQIAALETARDAWRRAASPNVFQRVGRAVPWIAAGVVVGVALSR